MDFDHLLIGIWIRVKLRKIDKQKTINRLLRYDIAKLKNENNDKTYKNNTEQILKLKTITEKGNRYRETN